MLGHTDLTGVDVQYQWLSQSVDSGLSSLPLLLLINQIVNCISIFNLNLQSETDWGEEKVTTLRVTLDLIWENQNKKNSRCFNFDFNTNYFTSRKPFWNPPQSAKIHLFWRVWFNSTAVRPVVRAGGETCLWLGGAAQRQHDDNSDDHN